MARPAKLVQVAQPGAPVSGPVGLAACNRAMSAAEVRCTTRFKNAHGTVFRELLYPWHPWFGVQVAVHEAIEKADGVVFRCTLSGSDADRWLEVPAWMFERASCPDCAFVTTSPIADMTALSALADLLKQTLKDRKASSNAPLSGASRSSHDEIRGKVHDSANISIRFKAKDSNGEGTRRSARARFAADGSVRRRTARRPDEYARVAGVAKGDASRADQPDDAADPGTRPRKQDQLSDGGQS